MTFKEELWLKDMVGAFPLQGSSVFRPSLWLSTIAFREKVVGRVRCCLVWDKVSQVQSALQCQWLNDFGQGVKRGRPPESIWINNYVGKCVISTW